MVKSGIHDMVDAALSRPQGTRLMILSPIVPADEARAAMSIGKCALSLQKKGFLRLRIDGEVFAIEDIAPRLAEDTLLHHRLEVVVDRLKADDKNRTRLAESFETALKLSDGRTILCDLESSEEFKFSSRYACPVCERTMPEMTPAMFSFNNALGACPLCEGAGRIERFDPDLVVRDAALTLRVGAVCGCTPQNRTNFAALTALSKTLGFSLDVAFGELPERVKDVILYGTRAGIEPPFSGIITDLERQWKSARSEAVKVGMRVLRRTMPCPACGGSRHRPEVRFVYAGMPQNRLNLIDIQSMTLAELAGRLPQLEFDPLREPVARPLLEEVYQGCGTFLSHAFALGRHALGWGNSAHQACRPNWSRAHGRDVCARRADDRIASARY